MDFFLLLLSLFLILWGVTCFVPERVLVIITALVAVVAGIIGLVRMF